MVLGSCWRLHSFQVCTVFSHRVAQWLKSMKAFPSFSIFFYLNLPSMCSHFGPSSNERCLSIFPFSRCDRVTCEFTQDPASCFLLPLRMSFYNISFPTNTPVPVDVFRIGPSNSVPGDEILFNIVSGNEEGYFTVQQQAHGGVISLQHILSKAQDFFLTVEMRLIRYGTEHLYTAKIAVFVTHQQPIHSSTTFPY